MNTCGTTAHFPGKIYMKCGRTAAHILHCSRTRCAQVGPEGTARLLLVLNPYDWLPWMCFCAASSLSHVPPRIPKYCASKVASADAMIMVSCFEKSPGQHKRTRASPSVA